MKTVPGPLAALILSGDFFCVTLYEITSTLGPVVRLAAADFDALDENGHTYFCGRRGSGYPKVDLQKSRATGHWTKGLDADEWTLTALPTTQDEISGALTYPDVVGGTPWLQACRSGFFQGAACVVRRGYWASPPTVPQTALSRTCAGSLILFNGLVGQVDCTTTQTVLKISDYKILLHQTMPRNVYQASCRNRLGDARCGVNIAALAKTAAAASGSTPYAVKASPATPGGSGVWPLGMMTATSGANAGFSRVIADWSAGSPQIFRPQAPFPFPVSAGDGFSFTPGCDKSLGAHGCSGFANVAKFRAEPRIPTPEVQL